MFDYVYIYIYIYSLSTRNWGYQQTFSDATFAFLGRGYPTHGPIGRGESSSQMHEVARLTQPFEAPVLLSNWNSAGKHLGRRLVGA